MQVVRLVVPDVIVMFAVDAAVCGINLPFEVGLLGPSGRVVGYSSASIDDAEKYAAERVGRGDLFGAVVSLRRGPDKSTAVSRLLPN